MRVGSLFTGYGGLDLAVETALDDADLAWVADNDPAVATLLAQRFPHVPNLGDVTKLTWTDVPPVDVLTGGTPCQDVSHAGHRAGMTEGTRSNLWVAMREAIAVLRPRLIVWENVKGVTSARADTDLEPCPRCMGDLWADQSPMRALGRVLGDLAELGFDAQWGLYLAADVGAPHLRARVFVLAWPKGDPPTWVRLRDLRADGRDPVRPLAHDLDQDEDDLDDDLLPTPAVNDMGDNKSLEWWDEWAPRQVSSAGAPAPHGRSLAIEAKRLLPTPSAADSLGGHHNRSGDRRDEFLLGGISRLLPTPSRADGEGGPGGGHREGGPNLRTEIRTLPTPTATDAKASGGGGNPSNVTLTDATVRNRDRWGRYAAAVDRWETVLNRPAPAPTEPSTTGGVRLAPAFVEWMMGLPSGWVTDAELALSRRDQLRALGNGVVPLQGAYAIHDLVTIVATHP